MTTNVQLMFAVNSLLVVILGFFIRMWIRRIEKAIEGKVEIKFCDFVHKEVEKCVHKHATTGSAGEVIPR